MRLRLYIHILCGFLFAAPGVMAASGSDIAAVVGSEVISSYDLDARVRFMIVTSGLPSSPEVAARLRPQVIRSLIDERLQAQEAARDGITPSDPDVKNAIAELEKDRGMAPGAVFTLMRQHRIPDDVFTAQIRAQLAWRNYVMKHIRPRIRVDDAEVEIAKKHFKETPTEYELKIAALTLPVDKPAREQEVRQMIQKLAADLRAGANFDEISRQLTGSKGASEAFWIRPQQLDPALASGLAGAKAGALAGPVRTQAGYTLVKVYDTRPIASRTPKDDSPEAISARVRAHLLQQKMELEVEKRMRDLRRDTFIEIRSL